MPTLEKVKPLLVLVAIGLLVYATIDCSRTPDADVPNTMPRTAWLVLILVLPILGPLFWLVATRTEETGRYGDQGAPRDRSGYGPVRGRKPGGANGRGPSSRNQPHGPVGPDDDPDFLRGL